MSLMFLHFKVVFEWLIHLHFCYPFFYCLSVLLISFQRNIILVLARSMLKIPSKLFLFLKNQKCRRFAGYCFLRFWLNFFFFCCCKPFILKQNLYYNFDKFLYILVNFRGSWITEKGETILVDSDTFRWVGGRVENYQLGHTSFDPVVNQIKCNLHFSTGYRTCYIIVDLRGQCSIKWTNNDIWHKVTIVFSNNLSMFYSYSTALSLQKGIPLYVPNL